MKKCNGWLLAGLMTGMVMFSGLSVSARDILQKQVIWDAENVVITADGIVENEYSKILKIHAENSGSKDVTMLAEKVWVNGVALKDYVFLELPAGEAVDRFIEFGKSTLDLVGIDTAASIEFDLKLLDPDSYDEISSSDLITLITEGNGEYEQIYDESGDVVYDANGVKIIFKGKISDVDSILRVLAFFTENNSGTEISFTAEDALINGAESDFWAFDMIPDGRASLTSVWVMDELDTLDNIEMNINIMDGEAVEILDSFVYQNADPALLSGITQAEPDYGEEDAKLAAMFDQTLTEQVIFDKEGVVITAKDMSVKGRYVLLNLQAENQLDYPVQANISRLYVNKGSVEVNDTIEIAAGANCEQAIAIPADALIQWGFDRVADIDFELFVCAADISLIGNNTIFESANVRLTTDGNEDYRQKFDIQGEVLYDSDGLRILSIGVVEKNEFEKHILFYVENQREYAVSVSGSNIIVDGNASSIFVPYLFGVYVPSGMYNIGWFTDEIGADGDISVDSVEMTLEISNNDTFELLDSVDVTFDPAE